MHSKFQVGEREIHIVEIFCSSTGTEVFQLDGQEIWRSRRLKLSSTINFPVGIQEVHSVTIKLRPFAPMAQAFVDGKLVIDQLFLELARIEEMSCLQCYVVFMIVGAILIWLAQLIDNLQPPWPLEHPLFTALIVFASFEITRFLVRWDRFPWLSCGKKIAPHSSGDDKGLQK